MERRDLKPPSALIAMACLSLGLVLIGHGLNTLGLPWWASRAFAAAWIIPGATLALGVVLSGFGGVSAKAQGAAHGAAKQDGG